jgi:hypothetical protein
MSKKNYKKPTEKYKITQTTEQLTGTKIKYGSATYCLLVYAVMKSRMKENTFSTKDISHVLTGKLKNQSDAKRAAEVLVKAGCLRQATESTWVVTKFGTEVRKKFAWYGTTNRENKFYALKNRSSRQRKEISWEDEIEINL